MSTCLRAIEIDRLPSEVGRLLARSFARSLVQVRSPSTGSTHIALRVPSLHRKFDVLSKAVEARGRSTEYGILAIANSVSRDTTALHSDDARNATRVRRRKWRDSHSLRRLCGEYYIAALCDRGIDGYPAINSLSFHFMRASCISAIGMYYYKHLLRFHSKIYCIFTLVRAGVEY